MSGLLDILTLGSTTSICQTKFQASLAHVSLTNRFLPPLASITDTAVVKNSTDQTQPSAMEAAFVEAAYIESRKTAGFEPTTEASGFSSTGNSTWDSIAGLQLIRHVSSNIPCSSCSSQSDSSCDSFCLDEMVSEFIEEDSDVAGTRKPAFEPSVASAAQDGPRPARDVREKRESHVYDAPAGTWRCQFCGDASCNGQDCQRLTSYHGHHVTQQRGSSVASSEIERLASMIEPLSCCETPEEYAVFDVVIAALEHARTPAVDVSTCSTSSSARNAVVHQLRRRGYDAAVCYSQWDYSNGVPDGSHEYCDVILHSSSPHRLPERLIVDLDFRAQFQVARPTPQYSYILQLTPAFFVGCPDRLHRLVEILSEAMRLSLHAQGMHVPPWRRHQYLAAKWTAAYSRQFSVPAECSSDSGASAAAAAAVASAAAARTGAPTATALSSHLELPAQLDRRNLGFSRALSHQSHQHRPRAAVVGLLARGMQQLALQGQAVV
ncbi:hypothetical protein CLOM_g3296 [Closterium sp. NIES-68]|nr:hypothetical protein CLOM_g3296 [Closterium sp. NIES-68]GJP73092.1 hypothetical protein CLOP_g3839 [Closterium sp. NIES-67]